MEAADLNPHLPTAQHLASILEGHGRVHLSYWREFVFQLGVASCAFLSRQSQDMQLVTIQMSCGPALSKDVCDAVFSVGSGPCF